ncbi:TIGR02300 family protein [Rhizobium sp. C1]|uniref:TIGR02300 family protein n=1 Tax=Rhizobium sp. C1 TaxID=1349799 RepID=UPI001E62688A|nr:TIGR02300 family protein [Rhizobium sp. C1]MCD2178316.1 TIGR02300 family protein [Rhizobium sp. C1]
MAKAELGTKRVDPDTGRKFYDLNRDPIVSPYTGKSYPLSFFEETKVSALMEKEEEEDVAEVDTENPEIELVSLEDADDDAAGGAEDLPDLGDDDVELDDDDDDTFLEADEDDEDDDMSGIISVNSDEDEV